MKLVATFCLLACAVVQLGCSSDSSDNTTPGGTDSGANDSAAGATTCTGPGDPTCGSARVCVSGYCRLGCSTDVECPQGSICIGGAPPFGCQLPQDLACNDTDDKCTPPLVCGLDKLCRTACAKTTDCPRNEHTCVHGTCVGANETGAGAVAMRGCEENDTACGDKVTTGACEVPDAGLQPCANLLYECNVSAPGWGLKQSCTTCTGAASPPYGAQCQ